MPLQIESVLLDLLTTDPATPADGQVWYNTTYRQLRVQHAGVTKIIYDLKCNFESAVDPTASNDRTQNYSIGSRWINTVSGHEFVCVNDTATAAVWVRTTCGSPMLQWGNDGITITTTTRYLTPGYGNGNALVTAIQFRVPRAGTIRNLRVHHSIVGAGTNTVAYTLRKNSANQTLTCSVAANASDANDMTNSFAVAAGDLLDVVVTKAANLGGSPQNITATVEYV